MGKNGVRLAILRILRTADPHKDMICKTVLGTNQTVDHRALKETYEKNRRMRPVNLDEWQRMFQEIHPRAPGDKARSTLELFEEVGELAESVRVQFSKAPTASSLK